MSPVKNTYVEIQQSGRIQRSHSIKENVNPIWDSIVNMIVNREHMLYFIVKHDGLIYDSDIAYGTVDIKGFDLNQTFELNIPLFDSRNNSNYNIGRIIGYLDIEIRILYK